MMTQYMAFLRAINVGGRRVKMDHLCSLFGALHLANVESYIASGNVIFETQTTDARSLERTIEQQLLDSLGYPVETFLRTSTHVAGIAAYAPFAQDELAAEGNQLYVAFLREVPDADAQQRLLALRTPVDDFHVNGKEAYWLRRRTVGETAFTAAVLEKAVGGPATMRNMNTVSRMVKKYVA